MASVQQELRAFGGNVRVIGVTGGVCSGKSNACHVLSSHLDIHVIDADKVSHTIYAPGTECFLNVVAEFGAGIVKADDGSIDRQKLGALVWGPENAPNLQRLNAIVWPAVQGEVLRMLKEWVKGVDGAAEHRWGLPTAAVEAALLLEASWFDMLDCILLCGVPPEEAVLRLQQRNSLTEAQARQRLASQNDNNWRREKCNGSGLPWAELDTTPPKEITAVNIENAIIKLCGKEA